MREILFRGKRKSDGKWICGMYDNEKHSSDFDCIIPRRDSEDHGSADWAVIPETVGQYTGLTDKNGVRIFEGDIYHQGDLGIKYVVEWHDTSLMGRQVRTKGSRAGLTHWRNAIEVIGNIHDNPELR